MEQKLPLPPFTMETALQKVQLAEDAWNSKDPEKVCMAYTPDSEWRNRTDFINGREAIKAFLKKKWEKELDYRLKKNSGDLEKTVWQCGLNMNGTTWRGNGFVVMETKCGNLIVTD